jgi:hypothetical protein
VSWFTRTFGAAIAVPSSGHEGRGDRGRGLGGVLVLLAGLFLEERGETDLEAGGPAQSGDLAGKRADVVGR